MSEQETTYPSELPTEWEAERVFPYPEGTHFEFKYTVNLLVDLNALRDKWTTIICGMLNSGGGWFIIGIEDTEHKVKGLDLSRKDRDDFKLWVDSLYRNIVLSDGTAISKPEVNLVVNEWKVRGSNKLLLSVKCFYTTKKKNIDFQLSSGQIYHRLNASTILMHGEPVYRQSQIYQRERDNSVAIEQFKKEIEKKGKELITKELERRKLQQQLDKKTFDYEQLQVLYDSKENERRRFQQGLDREKHKNLKLVAQHRDELRDTIQSTSDILYRYYNKRPETQNDFVINVQPDGDDVEPDDSQAKNKKQSKGKITALAMISCGIVGTVMWFADKILLLSI